MAYWGGGGASGWSHDGDRPTGRRGRIDGWNYEELGKVYDPRLMRRLLPFIAPYKGRALLALLGMIGPSAASSTQPFLMGLAVIAL